MVPEMIHHGTISKAFQRLKLYLDHPHAWYWQRPWEELSDSEQQDILAEFELHDDYAKCGVWKSELHRANEERRFLFDTTRKLEQLPKDLEGTEDHMPIGLTWLLQTDLPPPVASIIYILNWSHLRKPAARYHNLMNWLDDLRKQGHSSNTV